MGLHRLTIYTTVLFLVITSPLLVFSQAITDDNGTVLKIHRFQPPAFAITRVAPAATASSKPGGLSESVEQQINALELDKQFRTATQNKISSRLLYTARMLEGQSAAPGVSVLYTNLELDEQDNLFVDIRATVNDNLVKKLQPLGVRIVHSDPAYGNVRALVSPYQLEAIASLPEVTFIAPRNEARTVAPGQSLKGSLRPGFAQRAARLRQSLSAQLSKRGSDGAVCTGQGSVTSEGYTTHRVDDACATFSVRGAGVKIGVLSDGVTSLAISQGTGDLPADVTVLSGQTGSGDEGTAMLEIVHDLAPDAKLYFATAFTSIESFAQNIRNLRTAGCDIIVDDVFYFVESPFQDGQAPSVVSEFDGGVVIQAANDVVADGAMYFSSAGNNGNKDDGSSGTYENDFIDGGSNPHLSGGKVNKFGTTPYDAITSPFGGPILLHWTDPLGGSGNDYDLFLTDSTGNTLLDASTDPQDGTQDPIEGVGTDDLGDQIIVFKATAAAGRFLHVEAFDATLAVSTSGEVHGHAGASRAFAVAATPADLPFDTGFPSGPFPNPFNTSNVIEPYSSDGPRHIFFEADSTPITPGNFSSSGGTTLQKPEYTAADGVSVSGVDFFTPFYGTSAAAPHAAAIAALVKSADTTLKNSEIAGFLTTTAVDIMGASTERDSGAGIIMAFEAVQAALAPPAPKVSLSTTVLTFGNQAVGTTSQPQASILTNTGNTTLTITSVGVTGANSGDFAESNNCGNTVPAGGSCQISVTFTPSATGSRTATVSITDNAADSPQAISLSGVGGVAVGSVSPSSLAFGSQPVNTTSAPQKVSLFNTGDAQLTVSSFGLTGDFAIQTNHCTNGVKPGTHCDVFLVFAPTQPGAQSGILSFVDNATNSPQTVSLTGVGTSTTSTTLTSAPNPSALGQAVTLTAVVEPTYSGTPTGTVTFYDGTASLGTAVLNLGAAGLVTSALVGGTHNLTATYSGDAVFQQSTSPIVVQIVKQGLAAVTLGSNPNPSFVSQAVTFSAMVTGVNGVIPTGSVSFQQGNLVLATVQLINGKAVYNTAFGTSGTRSIKAVYLGDSNYPGQTSNVVKQVVKKYASSASVASSLNPSVYGQAVNLTSQVTSAAPSQPTGTVTFKNGASSLGTVPLVNGFALLTKKNLPAGTLLITATYNGDNLNNKNTSPTLSQVVSQATTTTKVVSSPNPSNAGQNVTFKATVKSPTAVPVGTVTFTAGTTTLGTVSLAGGKASLTTSVLPVGKTTVTATYNGTSNIAGSAGSVVQTVK